jgi:hypothetical protein
MLRKRSKPPARSLAFGLLAAALGSRGSFESAGGNERRRGRDLAMVDFEQLAQRATKPVEAPTHRQSPGLA